MMTISVSVSAGIPICDSSASLLYASFSCCSLADPLKARLPSAVSRPCRCLGEKVSFPRGILCSQCKVKDSMDKSFISVYLESWFYRFEKVGLDGGVVF